MKLSKKIKQEKKRDTWQQHARQLEAEIAELTEQRATQCGLIEALGKEVGTLTEEVKVAAARPRLADLQPSFEVNRPVLFILAEVMARAGMREVEIDPDLAKQRHDGATVEIDRDIYTTKTTLTLRYPCTCNTASFCHQHGTPHEQPADAPDLVTRYQRLVSKAFDELGGDILAEDDPAHFWLDRLESLLFKHLIPAWLERGPMKQKYLEERFGSPIIHGQYADGLVDIDCPYAKLELNHVNKGEAERFIERWHALIEYASGGPADSKPGKGGLIEALKKSIKTIDASLHRLALEDGLPEAQRRAYYNALSIVRHAVEPSTCMPLFEDKGQKPERAIVFGEPETPCVPERDGKHEWYSDGEGGAICRRCGLQTVKGA